MFLERDSFFTVVHAFNEQAFQVPWKAIYNNEEHQEMFQEAMDAIMYNLVYADDIEADLKERLVGRLTIINIRLAELIEQKNKLQEFIRLGQQCELILREIINASDWLTDAEKRFEAYQTFQENLTEDQEVKREELVYFRPVFIALGIMTLLTLDQECDENDNC